MHYKDFVGLKMACGAAVSGWGKKKKCYNDFDEQDEGVWVNYRVFLFKGDNFHGFLFASWNKETLPQLELLIRE